MSTTDTNRHYFFPNIWIWFWYHNYFYYFSTTGNNASIDITAPINESSEAKKAQVLEPITELPNPTTENTATKTDSSEAQQPQPVAVLDPGTESSNPSDELLPILLPLFVGLVIAGAIALMGYIYYKKRNASTLPQKDDIDELLHV